MDKVLSSIYKGSVLWNVIYDDIYEVNWFASSE